MHSIQIQLKALEPLILTNGLTEGMAHTTLEYIPGNMLLGAMAGQWLRKNKGIIPAASQVFRDLFLTGSVCWGNAYPEVAGEKSVPLPLSFRKFKNTKGISTVGLNQKEIALNLLQLPEGEERGEVLWAAYQNGYPELASSGEHQKTPPKVQKISAPFIHPKALNKPDTQLVWNMHVALEEGKRTAAESQLFGYEAVAKGTVFIGDVCCHTESDVSLVKELIESAGRFRVGHSRSAGYGLVEAVLLSVSSVAPSKQPVDRKIQIMLGAEYIPSCSWQTPVQNLQEQLAKALGCTVSIDEKNSYCAYTGVSGFSGVWRLPKTTRTALQKGSVFTVALSEEGIQSPSVLTLGGMRAEGFGIIFINPEFLNNVVLKSNSIEEECIPTNKCNTIALSPMLKVMRKRAAQRCIDKAVSSFIENSDVRAMLYDLGMCSQPTQSQRSRIRNMLHNKEVQSQDWCSAFKLLLSKTPGRQWENAVTHSPFSKRKEHLNLTMMNLLDFAVFYEQFKGCLELALPGDTPCGEELKDIQREFHRVALCELISVWSMRARLPRKSEQEGESNVAV